MQSLSKRRFLVTGGAGFVGSHLVLALVDRGADVVVIDNLRQGHRAALPSGVRLVVADLGNHACGSRIGRLQYADRIHQFLDRDGRMVDLPLQDQIVQYMWRSIQHLIDVDAAIEQQGLPADAARVDERKLLIASPCQRPLWIEPRPAPRRIEIELRHLRNRASTFDRPCLETA